MTRRAPLAVVLLAFAALCAPPASAQDRATVGTPTGKFPERSLRLTVPERPLLDASQVEVLENGDPVSDVEVTSAGTTQRSFGAVLVIDASISMRGRAIRGAMAAARALVARRAAGQRIGVVTFNRVPTVRLPPTDDPAALSRALAKPPPLGPKTRIFDAVGLALDQLRQAQIDAGSIVVLSDGADTGSAITLQNAVRRARQQQVRVYTVGLRSTSFDPGELETLASAGQGRYTAAASVSALQAVFRDLGDELASEYLIQYRSQADPGRTVRVAVRVDGVPGVATSAYSVPGGASFVLVEDNFWTSTLGLVMAGLAFMALLALALAILLLRRLKGPDLRTRVKSFVFPVNADLTQRPSSQPKPRTASLGERMLSRLSWWDQFKEDVEIARIEMSPVRIVGNTVLATLVTMCLFVLVSGIPALGLAAFAVPFGVRTLVRFKRDRQRNLFADQLPDMLQGTASAMRAGHSFVGALAIIVEDAPEPSRKEFKRVVAEEQLGVPLDEALTVVQRRMESRDVQQVALVAQIQREAGGNSAEVLDRVTDTVRQRGELQRMVRALTAQGRLSRWIVTALPVGLLVIISLVNPRYMEPLFETGVGRFLLLISAVTVTMGSLVIKKIVDFKV